MIITVVLAFAVPITLIVMISQLVSSMRDADVSSSAVSLNAAATQLRPVADVAFADSAPAPSPPKTGGRSP